jgi:hypothetical protein
MTTLNEDGKSEIQLPHPLTLYTEVSSLRAIELKAGKLESQGEAKSNIIRWLSEIVLAQTQPDHLRTLGVSRDQLIFASPTPYQGSSPMAGKVLMAFDTDPALVYVAEGDHLTAMRQFGVVDFSILSKLQQMMGRGLGITQKEFLPQYESLPAEMKDKLSADITPLSLDYWGSVVPYADYRKLPHPYAEPETLLTSGAPITNIRELSG